MQGGASGVVVAGLGSGFRVQGSGLRVSGFRVQGMGLRVLRLGYMVYYQGFRVSGLVLRGYSLLSRAGAGL